MAVKAKARVAGTTANTVGKQPVPPQLTPWKPGQSGNPKGRPPNAKQKLSDTFLADMLEAWERDGKDAIARVVKDRPHEFIKSVAAIVPKDINVRAGVVEELTDDELAAAISALRSVTALAEAREGSETASRH